MSLRHSSLSALPILAPLAFAAFAFAACSSSSDSPVGTTTGGPSGDRTLVVLFTSDEHSHLFSFSPELDDFPSATAAGTGALVGGLARRATVLAKERAAAKAAGKDSVLVSAGDNQMGTLSEIAFEASSVDWGTMKALGYDVTTFGNHEFDFGPKALAASINAAKKGTGLPPIVSSNIHFSTTSPDDDDLASLYSAKAGDSAPVHPYQVVTTASGLKVGFIGIIGVNAEHVAPNKTPVQFSAVSVDPKKEGDLPTVLPKLYADLQPIVDTLRNTEKVNLVIALSHSGENDTSTDMATAAGEDYQIAANVKGLDLIVSGHSHNPDPKPITVKNPAGTETLVLNGSSFGQHIGRVELTVHADGKTVDWNKTTQALIPVDDSTVPDTTAAATIPGIVSTLEKTLDIGDGKPYLARLLSHVEGSAISDDTSKAGDLYFYPIGKTSYDLTDDASLVALSADAMLAAADAQGIKAMFGLESAGVIRGVIKQGKTGVISAADAFNIVPLGSSIANGTIGYPLIRANVALFELRGVLEFALTLGPTTSDYDLIPAGLKVEYDKSRPPVVGKLDIFNPAKGWVMKISVDTDHTDGFEQYDKVLYDRTMGIGKDADLVSAITSSYIGQFASDVGATLKDDMGMPMTITQAIVHRQSDMTEVKQVESFLSYIKASPGGTLPPQYNAKSPMATKRFICVGGC